MLSRSLLKIKFLSLLFLCLFIIPKDSKAFWPFTDACIGVYMDPAGIQPLTLSSTSSDNTNSYAQPRIYINANGCAALAKISCNLSVGLNETVSCHDFGIKAFMTMASVNDMNNAYHVGDAFTITSPITPDSTTTLNLAACAQNKNNPLAESVCNFYAQMFNRGLPDKTGTVYKGYFVAICAYITSSQEWWQSFTNFFKNIFSTTGEATTSAMNGSWTQENSPPDIPGYRLIGCSPTVVAPFPPPYGIPTGPIYQITPTVQPICQNSTTPVYTIGTARSSICLPPKDGVTYSTFSKTCMRVNFPNPVRTSSGSSTSPTISILDGVTPSPSTAIATNNAKGVGSDVQALYTWPSSNISTCSGTGCTFASTDYPLLIPYAQIYDSNAGTVSSPIFQGYNLAGYADLCYDFTTNTADTVQMIDIYGNQRNFTVVPSCEVTTCSTINPLYEETQICLKDTDSDNFLNCANRPSMTPPTVSFCPNQENTPSNICMNVTIPDTNATCQLSYNISTNTLINGCKANNISLSAIVTDRCGNFAISAPVPDPSGAPTSPLALSFFAPYTTAATTCNCPSTQTCSTTSSGLCYQGGYYKYGASKFCLLSFSVPMAQPQSSPSCTENCNSVCINSALSGPTPSLCSRINPLPSSSSLTSDQFCFVTQHACTGANCVSTQQTSTAAGRAKLPIENGLCTDVLLFDITDCSQITNPTYQAQCQTFQQYCTQKTGNKYTNFDSCNTTYSSCLTNPGPQSPTNNCYYIKQNSQYTPPTIPTKCPAGWTPQSACTSGTFNNLYFYAGNNTPHFQQLSNMSGANSVGCYLNGNSGDYAVYCCDGTPFTHVNDICPDPN
jgi:hypothetical protein